LNEQIRELFARLVRKLRGRWPLSAADVAAIQRLPVQLRSVPAQTVIVAEGDRPTQSFLLLEGFAGRSKATNSGRRQFLSFHVPGDIPDLQCVYLQVMDHDVTALAPCSIAYIAHVHLRELIRERPEVANALWCDTLIDAAIFREWILNVGRRPADERMAHLFCEIVQRLDGAGLGERGCYELPLTQTELADALGLSAVHVNRVLQEIRGRGLVEFHRSTLLIRDAAGLRQLGGYDPLYLHEDPAS
jgi:CRP-like cAMP-binding protein